MDKGESSSFEIPRFQDQKYYGNTSEEDMRIYDALEEAVRITIRNLNAEKKIATTSAERIRIMDGMLFMRLFLQQIDDSSTYNNRLIPSLVRAIAPVWNKITKSISTDDLADLIRNTQHRNDVEDKIMSKTISVIDESVSEEASNRIKELIPIQSISQYSYEIAGNGIWNSAVRMVKNRDNLSPSVLHSTTLDSSIEPPARVFRSLMLELNKTIDDDQSLKKEAEKRQRFNTEVPITSDAYYDRTDFYRQREDNRMRRAKMIDNTNRGLIGGQAQQNIIVPNKMTEDATKGLLTVIDRMKMELIVATGTSIQDFMQEIAKKTVHNEESYLGFLSACKLLNDRNKREAAYTNIVTSIKNIRLSYDQPKVKEETDTD